MLHDAYGSACSVHTYRQGRRHPLGIRPASVAAWPPPVPTSELALYTQQDIATLISTALHIQILTFHEKLTSNIHRSFCDVYLAPFEEPLRQ